MRISATSGVHSMQTHRSTPSRSNGEPAYPDNSGSGNSIRVEDDLRIELGSINGKPLFMWNTPLGGFGWTGTPAVQGPPIGKVSQADLDALRLASSYTRSESEYAYKIVTVVNGLFRLTRPSNLPLSVQRFNDLLIEQSISSDVVHDALKRLGINANETFTVNGQKMRVADSRFVLVS